MASSSSIEYSSWSRSSSSSSLEYSSFSASSTSSGEFEEDVVLLLHCDGEHGDDKFIDSARGGNAPHPVTANGSAQIDATDPKFGSGCALFEKDNETDYLLVPTDSDFDVRTGDFTIECWPNPSSSDANQMIWAVGPVEYNSIELYWKGVNVVYFVGSTNGSSWTVALDGGALAAGTYSHIAVVRQGSTFRLYVDGVQVDSAVNAAALTLNNYEVKIGAESGLASNWYYDGRVDEFRFTKGHVWYPDGTTFDPPDGPFPPYDESSSSQEFSSFSTSSSQTGEDESSSSSTSTISTSSTSTVSTSSSTINLSTSSQSSVLLLKVKQVHL